jgi:hypothetical protein
MKKSEREIVFNKYGGRCAYCGCELQKGWHVDELLPVVRDWEYVPSKGKSNYDMVKRTTGMRNPENLNIENQMPACASCNILKSSQSIEGFRLSISGFIKSLNSYVNQYKFAKRYGLVEEINKPVVFFFEKLNKEQSVQASVATKAK